MCTCGRSRRLGYFFFFQAEDGIRDKLVTGVQTCALPISDLLERGMLRIADLARDALLEELHRPGWKHTLEPGTLPAAHGGDRSEERRVGKECRSRWSPYH